MPPRFSNLTPPAAAATPAPSVQTPAVETAPEIPATSSPTVFQPSNAAAALLAVVETDAQQSKFTPAFPTVEVVGGNTGGQFRPLKSLAEAVRDILPDGEKPIPCVILGYRTQLFAWATESAVKDPTPGAKSPRPVWSVNVPASNVADYQLIAKAVSHYTFDHKKGTKGAYDIEHGVGHIKAQFQALVYLPTIDQLAVIQGVALYQAWVGSCASVAKLLTRDGTIAQIPVAARVVTTDQKGADAWKLHTLTFDTALPATITRAEVATKWATFSDRHKDDQQLNADVMDWLTAKDHPITDDIRNRLTTSLTF